MNYYNPYFYSMPANGINTLPKMGLFRRMFGNINFASILNGTQRTLNIVNQTIPLVKQARPILKNAKTMFKVMNEFKKVDVSNTPTNITKKQDIVSYNDGPTFFI